MNIQINRLNKTYTFEYGAQAYIFHTGVYKELDRIYGTETLTDYVELVFDCYLSDMNRTPLGALADFVAENRLRLKDMERKEILIEFYDTEALL